MTSLCVCVCVVVVLADLCGSGASHYGGSFLTSRLQLRPCVPTASSHSLSFVIPQLSDTVLLFQGLFVGSQP